MDHHPTSSCGCGCGATTNLDKRGRPRRYVQGHNRRGCGTGWVEQGYRFVCQGGKKRALHRVIVEESLGRTLGTDEVVHHVDHDRLNNAPDNLVVLSRSEHTRLHRRVASKRWSPEEKERAGELYEAGMSIDEVARALGRPYSSTRTELARQGRGRAPEETRRLRRPSPDLESSAHD